MRLCNLARWSVLALAGASSACVVAGSDLVSANASSDMNQATQTLSAGSLKSINGTYGAGCVQRSGAWSVRVSGTDPLANPALTVVKHNTACALTVTSLVADQTYTGVPAIALTAAYQGTASAFQAAGSVSFYANAKLDDASFANDFVLSVLVSDDPRDTGISITSTPAFDPLGTARTFAVLAASTITITPAPPDTILFGDVGLSPGTSITGLSPGQPTGTVYIGGLAVQAQMDLTAAYDELAAMPCDPANDMTGVNLGGKTLIPGVYCFPGNPAAITGDLVFDAQFDPAAVWVIQVGSTLTTATNATVSVINGGNACNVYWQVGSSATLLGGTAFLGSIVAFTSITVVSGANVAAGRVLAQNGAVTMDSNTISAADCL